MTDAATLLNSIMRYLVKAKVKEGKRVTLLRAIEDETLGRGSIAGDEYRYDMETSAHRIRMERRAGSKLVFAIRRWQEERPYWEKYFDLLSVKDAHSRRNCRHENGTEALGLLRLRLHAQAGRETCTKEDEAFLPKLRSSLMEEPLILAVASQGDQEFASSKQTRRQLATSAGKRARALPLGERQG